jgi:BirA family transcriptional regulator, biotin operon repressor / biotin---[acetyl-CoA-carboxylase] ligase
MPLIDTTRLKARLGPLAGRFDVDALTECDSTNAELQRRADAGAPAGTVIVTDQQSAGRGRRGRTWLSSPAGSLTFSCLWRFPRSTPALSGLSLAVGLAIVRTLNRLGARGVGLKWPNDVLCCRGETFAKLAGILVELASDRRGSQAIIGIGINLAAPEAELPQAVAGLNEVFSDVPERHDLLAALLGELAVTLDDFAVDGFAGLKTDWEAHHAWQHRPVRLIDEQLSLSGLCLGVDADGALLLQTASGTERVLAGDVSLRPA